MLSNNLSCGIIGAIKKIITPTGEIECDKQRARDYAKAVGMDAANSKMMEVMTTQGPPAAAKAMVGEFTSDDGKFDYAAMRARYG